LYASGFNGSAIEKLTGEEDYAVKAIPSRLTVSDARVPDSLVSHPSTLSHRFGMNPHPMVQSFKTIEQ
jgi:hypothetical protein